MKAATKRVKRSDALSAQPHASEVPNGAIGRRSRTSAASGEARKAAAMQGNGTHREDSLIRSEVAPELIAYIEQAALSETAPFAPQCRKVLRMLRVGASYEEIQSELQRIRAEFAQRKKGGPRLRTRTKALEKDTRLRVPSVRLASDVERLAAAVNLATTQLDVGGLLGQLLPSRIDTIRHKLFLNVQEAAEYSGLPLATIRRLIARNELPAAKAGGWRIKRSYLEKVALRHLRRLAIPHDEPRSSSIPQGKVSPGRSILLDSSAVAQAGPVDSQPD